MFLFSTQNDLEEAVSKLQEHFERFGLIMHVGNSTTKSKSEAMYSFTKTRFRTSYYLYCRLTYVDKYRTLRQQRLL